MLPLAKLRTSAATGLLLALLAPSALAQCHPHNPGVVPIKSRVGGKSYGEWGAAWWQWVLSSKWADNPLNDPDGHNAAHGQDPASPVWFLAGTFGGTAVRSFTVPRGKYLFLPLINWEWDTVPGFALPKKAKVSEPLSVKDIYRLAEWCIDLCDEKHDLWCTIDGRKVDKPQEYRAKSPVFSFTFADDLWGPPYLDPHVDTAVTDGYWLMLEPMTPGVHHVTFMAHIDPVAADGPPPAWQGLPGGFDVAVFCTITVL